MQKSYILLLLLLLFSCSKEDDLQQETLAGPEINIYLTKPGSSSFYNPADDLNTLEIENEPWLHHSEVLFYDWSSHMFFLKNEKEKAKYEGRNFVVKADDEPLFAGVFFSMLMSSIPQIPSIIAQDGVFDPMDVVSFGQFGYIHSGNMNARQKFKNALVKAGLFKNGIEVALENVTKLSSAKLEYTFRVTNKDLENIYVLDPEKMSRERFFYFTNGISVKDEQTYYFSNSESIRTDAIKNEWYVKLHPGESLTRTLTQDGFQFLPAGDVTCTFVFPGSKVGKGEWLKTDGRIWLGNFKVEKQLKFN